MDKAIKSDPDNITVRMTRGTNSKNLPAFLKRSDIGIEDFEFLVGSIQDNSGFSNNFKKIVYGSLVELYERRNDDTKAKKYHDMINTLKN